MIASTPVNETQHQTKLPRTGAGVHCVVVLERASRQESTAFV